MFLQTARRAYPVHYQGASRTYRRPVGPEYAEIRDSWVGVNPAAHAHGQTPALPLTSQSRDVHLAPPTITITTRETQFGGNSNSEVSSRDSQGYLVPGAGHPHGYLVPENNPHQGAQPEPTSRYTGLSHTQGDSFEYDDQNPSYDSSGYLLPFEERALDSPYSAPYQHQWHRIRAFIRMRQTPLETTPEVEDSSPSGSAGEPG